MDAGYGYAPWSASLWRTNDALLRLEGPVREIGGIVDLIGFRLQRPDFLSPVEGILADELCPTVKSRWRGRTWGSSLYLRESG